MSPHVAAINQTPEAVNAVPDGISRPLVCRQLGVSSRTLHRYETDLEWETGSRAFMPDEVDRLQQVRRWYSQGFTRKQVRNLIQEFYAG